MRASHRFMQVKRQKTGSEMIRVMVTGASGLLGRSLMNAFKEHKNTFAVVGLGFSRVNATNGLIKVDLTDEKAVRDTVKQHQPHIIIHSAAERRPDAFGDPAKAKAAEKLNVSATQTLADCARSQHIKMVYVSTDYVFDGTKPPYAVGAAPNPVNEYGKTKLKGEQVMLAAAQASEKALEGAILRVPILYGTVEDLAESSVTAIVSEDLAESSVTTIVSDVLKQKVSKEQCDVQIRFPTYTEDVAAFLVQVCSWLHGPRTASRQIMHILHFSGQEEMTKYGMAQNIGNVLRLPIAHLTPSKKQVGGDRPLNAQLSLAETPKELKRALKFTALKTALPECLLPCFASLLTKSNI
eukprot:g21642.t1